MVAYETLCEITSLPTDYTAALLFGCDSSSLAPLTWARVDEEGMNRRKGARGEGGVALGGLGIISGLIFTVFSSLHFTFCSFLVLIFKSSFVLAFSTDCFFHTPF